MPFKKRFTPKRRNQHKRRPSSPAAPRNTAPSDPESTGYEAAYFRELIDEEVPVVIVLKTGEELRGQVRYYDRDVFSLGPADGGPKLFLRKSSVRYLYEE
ncbi:MAG TPA: hypothetical protein VFD58_24235 [Blastocatellia bacterium]|nr:hypothetical protein [Blastocatellia bacterium]